MVKVYIAGCISCGINGALVRKLKRAYDSVQVFNSRYDSSSKQEHLEYLRSANIGTGELIPIIVLNNEVMRLREWKS